MELVPFCLSNCRNQICVHEVSAFPDGVLTMKMALVEQTKKKKKRKKWARIGNRVYTKTISACKFKMKQLFQSLIKVVNHVENISLNLISGGSFYILILISIIYSYIHKWILFSIFFPLNFRQKQLPHINMVNILAEHKQKTLKVLLPKITKQVASEIENFF